MNRKDFLSSALPLSLAVLPFANSLAAERSQKPFKIPPYLKPGDTIGICCPSGYITLEDIQPAVDKIREWGFNVRIGKTVGQRDFTFAGPDKERGSDLQLMLDDPSIKAILFGRGGYGAVRIIDDISFSKFAAAPKWIIGFSDATVFHSHISRNYGIATIHSKMCNSFPKDWANAEADQLKAIDSIRQCLVNEKVDYPATGCEYNRQGVAEGILIGGNLSIIENLSGSISDMDTRDKILFLEETEEYLYNLDRMLWNLKRSGKLSHLKGLIIGGITKIKPDDPGEDFGRTIYDMVLEKVKEYPYPVCFDFPVGHQKSNYALKCGVVHTLTVTNNKVSLTQTSN